MSAAATHSSAGLEGLSPPERYIFAAAGQGEVNLLRDLVQAGVNPNVRTSKNWAPIHVAAGAGQLAAVRLLLDSGASHRAQTDAGYTAMHLAAQNGHLSIVMELDTRGASCEKLTVSGETPLHVAAICGQLAVAEWLVKRGVEIDSVTKLGLTALHLAVQQCHPAVVEMLLNSNARHDLWAGPNGQSPLHTAAQVGCVESARLLMDHGALHTETTRIMATPLHIATYANQLAVIEFLLEREANVHALDIMNFTPLMTATHPDVKKVYARFGHRA